MVQKIVQSGNPTLRRISKPVKKIDKKVLSLIQDLKDTLAVQKDPEGVGLAAPQIGKNLRIFVIVFKNLKRVVINPEIIKIGPPPSDIHHTHSSEHEILEGCLSLPHYYGPLNRQNYVKIKYQTLSTTDKLPVTKTEEFRDFNAQIILHEIDHLNGFLFIDRLLEQKKKLYKLDKDDEWEEVEI